MPTAAPPMMGWMNVLADTTRARLLRLLEQHELTVEELRAVTQQPQSTVSRHLKVLAEGGWVESRREGTSSLYRMSLTESGTAGRRLWLLVREQISAMAFTTQDDRRLAKVLAERRTRSQAFFTSAAGKWDKMRSELFGDRFDALALAGLLDESWTVGDLGCGTAQLSSAIAPFVKRVIAVDESAVMIRNAEQRLKDFTNIDLRRGNLAAMPIEDEQLDAAVLCMVLHHLPEPITVLREAARALKPGGKLLIIDMLHHDRTEFQKQMGHVWLGFEPAKLSEWLTEGGFTSIRISPLPIDPAAKGPALFAGAAKRKSQI